MPRLTAGFLFNISQHGLIIVAACGTGKHLLAFHAIQDQLHLGKAVVILDHGRSYLKFAEAMGGSFVWLLENGQHDKRVFGQAPLVVYDIERMPRGETWSGTLPSLRVDVRTANGFIANDEVGIVLRGVSSAADLTSSIAKAGGSYLVVAQEEDQVKALSGISVPFVMKMNLERR